MPTKAHAVAAPPSSKSAMHPDVHLGDKRTPLPQKNSLLRWVE